MDAAPQPATACRRIGAGRDPWGRNRRRAAVRAAARPARSCCSRRPVRRGRAVAAFGAALIAVALDAARPPGGESLRDDPSCDRAVAAGILAGLVGSWSSRRSPPSASARSSARCRARSWRRSRQAAWWRSGRCPARSRPSRRCRSCAHRPAPSLARATLGATGVLLITHRAAAVLAFIAALSRADWRVLDLGPLYALAVALLLGVAHGLFWFGSAPGRALARPPPGSARFGALVRDRDRRVHRLDCRGAPARRCAGVRCRHRLFVGPAAAARRRAPRDGPRRRRLLGALRRRRLRRHARRRLPGRRGHPRQRRRRELRGRRRQAAAAPAAATARRRPVGRAHRAHRAARRRLQGEPPGRSPSTPSAPTAWAWPAMGARPVNR